MNPNDKINELQRQIESEKNKIKNCSHSFKEAIYDPETVKEGYGSVQDGAGSDPHWSYAGYRDVQKDRWSRECKICGTKQYTYKQEPVISSYQPKFN
jgi:hypothetical protein